MIKQKINLVIIPILLLIIIFWGFEYFSINREFRQNQAYFDKNEREFNQVRVSCEKLKSVEKNLFNGTGQGFQGGSQAYGGTEVDVGSDGIERMPQDTYVCPLGWTKCTPENNYCDTGLSSADAKDNCTDLIWSLPCTGTGCSSFEHFAPGYYSWDSSGKDNNGLVASQLCSAGSHGQTGWFLPHQKQLMQAYINGAFNYLLLANGQYWSATTASLGGPIPAAYITDLISGVTSVEWSPKNSTNYWLRCVRPANPK